MPTTKIIFQKPGFGFSTPSGNGPGHGGGTLSYPNGPGHGGGTLSYPNGPGHGGGTLSATDGSSFRNNLYINSPSPGSQIVTLGYLTELPDYRDIKVNELHKHPTMTAGVKNGPNKSDSYLLSKTSDLPGKIDLRKDVRGADYFTPVENQGTLGSCTANAAIGLIEYLIKAETQQTIHLSRLFLYKVTRNLMNQTGDQGAYIRTTIKGLKMFGCPPEERWPYAIDSFDYEPDAFLYSLARNFKAISYLRLDDPGESGDKVLLDVKSCIADGFPSAFGFPVYSSINEVSEENDYTIPFPQNNDTLEGGHAVLAIGYDDERGALLIRNSWGMEWGNKGYAWLPYEYIKHGLARDFWTVLATDWVALADFG